MYFQSVTDAMNLVNPDPCDWWIGALVGTRWSLPIECPADRSSLKAVMYPIRGFHGHNDKLHNSYQRY